jgi:hypothetical protein
MQRLHLSPDQFRSQPSGLVQRWIRFLELEAELEAEAAKPPESDSSSEDPEIAEHRERLGLS